MESVPAVLKVPCGRQNHHRLSSPRAEVANCSQLARHTQGAGSYLQTAKLRAGVTLEALTRPDDEGVSICMFADWLGDEAFTALW